MIPRIILTLQSGNSTLPLEKEILTLSSGIPSFNPTIWESNPTIMKGKLSIVIKNFHSTLPSRIVIQPSHQENPTLSFGKEILTLLLGILSCNPAIKKFNPTIRKQKFNLAIMKSNPTITKGKFNPIIKNFFFLNPTIRKILPYH
jgi:hypothetical protein